MALNIEELEQRLLALMPKTVIRDDAALSAAAQNKYEPIYNAEVESTRQTQQQKDLALSQQIDRLAPAYEQGKQSIARQTESSVRGLGRSALSRGMQRSSYLNATMGNMENAGLSALAAHEAEYQGNVGQINQQRSQLEGLLAETLGRLETDKVKQISGYTDEMRQQDQKAAVQEFQLLSQLQLELAKMGYQQERDAVSDQQWQMNYDAKHTKTSSGGGGSKKKKSTTEGAEDPALKAVAAGLSRAVNVSKNIGK